MVIDWGSVVTQVLVVLAPVLAVALITYFSTLIANEIRVFRARYPKWASVLDEYAPVAVAAAEQLRKNGTLPTGQEALSYAVTAVQTYLNAHGVKGVDVSLIEAAVEAQVSQLPEFKPTVIPVVAPPVTVTVTPVVPPVVAQG